MAIAPATLTEIEQACAALQARAGDAVRELRQRFQPLVVLCVDAQDVQETPYRKGAGFDLHLLDTASHCINVVAEPQYATGILLAIHRTSA